MRSLPDCTSCRWHPDFADVTMKSADKGMGLSAIIARHGIKIEETMAFGDGGNDMSIIKKQVSALPWERQRTAEGCR